MARRHRNDSRRLVLLALAVAAAGVPAGCRGEGGGGPGRSLGSDTAPDGWSAIAPAPFGGRASALAVWTGTELLVVGGYASDVCPPTADCAREGTAVADAAAYDPGRDRWRELARAPLPIADGHAVWLGDRALFVVDGETTTLLYDPDSDTWARGADLPSSVHDGGLAVTPTGAVRFSYDQRPGAERATDFAFDATRGAWSPLPHDPFGESYDRSVAWHDDRLWLLSMSVEHHFGAIDGRPSRLAVLDDGAWRVVDAATPPVGQLQWILSQGDLLVVAENRDPAGPSRAYDAARDEWREVMPPVEGPPRDAACRLGQSAAGPHWITGGDRLVSAVPAAALVVPPCPGHAAFPVVAWAGERLVVWGGVPEMTSDDPTADGLVWTPPAPDQE